MRTFSFEKKRFNWKLDNLRSKTYEIMISWFSSSRRTLPVQVHGYYLSNEQIRIDLFFKRNKIQEHLQMRFSEVRGLLRKYKIFWLNNKNELFPKTCSCMTEFFSRINFKCHFYFIVNCVQYFSMGILKCRTNLYIQQFHDELFPKIPLARLTMREGLNTFYCEHVATKTFRGS